MDVDEAQDGGGEEGAPAWMATFSDLATLLLTFFVLLLSFANMDVQNFKTAMGSVKEAMGVQFEVNGDHEAMSTDLMELSPVQSGPHIVISEFSQLAAEKLRRYVKEKGLEGEVEVEAKPRGVVLRANDAVFFGVGSADLKKDTKVLALVADVFSKFDGDLAIQGHTDSVPINSGRYPSNWELSSARATAVMRQLTDGMGLPRDRVSVAGYADTKPIDPAKTKAAFSKNRRVEFLFEFPVVQGSVISEGAFDTLSDKPANKPSEEPADAEADKKKDPSDSDDTSERTPQ